MGVLGVGVAGRRDATIAELVFGFDGGIRLGFFLKRNANAFSLNAIVDVLRRRRREMNFLGIY